MVSDHYSLVMMVVSQKMVTLVYLEQLVLEEGKYEGKVEMGKYVEELLVQ